MSKRKAHSIHNEEVSNLLLTHSKYNDWVITAAFYSAMHLVLHQIFPLEKSGTKYESFDDYFATIPQKGVKKKSKHSVIADLVKSDLGRFASISYRSLFDNCHSARYNDYNVSPELAKKAHEDLKEVKSKCPK